MFPTPRRRTFAMEDAPQAHDRTSRSKSTDTPQGPPQPSTDEPEIQPADEGVHFEETAAAKAESDLYRLQHGLVAPPERWWSFSWATLSAAVVVAMLLLIRYMVKDDGSYKLFHEKLLAMYNGKGPNPVYISILGQVFDVTSGRKFYSEEGGYDCFVGRDASRAFITGEFKKELTDDVTGLQDSQMLALVNWRKFYHEKYKYKGRLVGRYYDASGGPTAFLRSVEEAAERAKEAEAKLEKVKKEYPVCNTQWSQAEGGVVWCDDGMYPRRIHDESFEGTPPKWRCACFKELGWSDLRQVYDDCDPDATRCQSSPPPAA